MSGKFREHDELEGALGARRLGHERRDDVQRRARQSLLATRSWRLVALFLALALSPACGEKTGDDGPEPPAKPLTAATTATAPVRPPAPSAPPEATPFDAARAFEHVTKQIAFGARPSGSPQLAATRKYIERELKSYRLAVREQSFTADTPMGKIPMVNVIAEISGTSPAVIVIGSHYDTSRTPSGFLGANDAGSSTGCLLEIARVMAEQYRRQKPRFGIQFVFFDGEEAAVKWTDTDSVYGSRHYVEDLEARNALEGVRAMILLDMIGDKNLNIRREGASTPQIIDIIWRTAAELGYGNQFSDDETAIEDDHTPFLQAGIPAVDLIDFTYGTERKDFGPGGPTNAYWHTLEDTADKLSPNSLKVVGDTIITSVPRILAALP